MHSDFVVPSGYGSVLFDMKISDVQFVSLWCREKTSSEKGTEIPLC
jgi:hypothetical protein